MINTCTVHMQLHPNLVTISKCFDTWSWPCGRRSKTFENKNYLRQTTSPSVASHISSVLKWATTICSSMNFYVQPKIKPYLTPYPPLWKHHFWANLRTQQKSSEKYVQQQSTSVFYRKIAVPAVYAPVGLAWYFWTVEAIFSNYMF